MDFAATPPPPPPVLDALPGDFAAIVDVTVDRARSLVTYSLGGFLGGGAVERLRDEQAAAMVQLRCPANQHVTIIDISRCKIQSQDVIEQFRAMLDDPRYQGRKLAVVVGSSLARMQIRRVLTRDTVTYVGTMAEAERWVFEG